MATPLLRNRQNQQRGAQFETYFEWEAKRADLLPVRNGQRVRWLPAGKMIAIKSNLDWTVLGREGLSAFVDTKSFQGKHFTFSQLDKHQMALCQHYVARGFVAGFVVHFRDTDVVSFFTAETLVQAGAGSRFEAAQGKVLGHLKAFDLRRIWA